MSLTKRLNFDDETLEVIRSVRFSDDGLEAKITIQLDRKLYVKVNKALEAMGGKWNRKAGAHLFPRDPRQEMEELLGNGFLTAVRDGWFPTPKQVVERMIHLHGGADGDVLEPEAGEGHIVDRLVEWGASKEKIHCVEKNVYRAKVLMAKGYQTQVDDFLLVVPRPRFDRVFMNPPFEERQDVQHIRHAHDFLRPGGTLVAVCSEGPFFANDSRSYLFRNWLKEIDAHVEELLSGAFKESGTGVNAKLVRTVKKISGKEEQLRLF